MDGKPFLVESVPSSEQTHSGLDWYKQLPLVYKPNMLCSLKEQKYSFTAYMHGLPLSRNSKPPITNGRSNRGKKNIVTATEMTILRRIVTKPDILL